MLKSVAPYFMLALLTMIGIEIGAGAYEAPAVVPLWAADPQAYYRFFAANPAFAMHAGQLWWIFITPLTTLIALLAALLAGQLPSPRSRLVRIAGVMIFLMGMGTFGWFVPTIIRLQTAAVLEMGADQAKRTAALWASLNWIRTAWFCAAFAIVLRAVYAGDRKASLR